MASFFILVILLGWIFSQIYQDSSFVIIAVVFSVVMNLWAYYYSDKVALVSAGAKSLKKKKNPRVYRLVENLSIASGLPIPKIYIIKDSAMNAFATGRDPKHASIALTTGLVEKLTKVELEGVIAHELSHVGNYDSRLMTTTVVLVGIVALLSDFFIRMQIFGRGGDSREGGQIKVVLLLVGLALAVLSPLFAKLIQLAISRKREYLADGSAALLTRYPEGLARALEKIAVDPHELKRANHATAHLYISEPYKKKSWLNNLFATHPPIAKRIKKLRSMA